MMSHFIPRSLANAVPIGQATRPPNAHEQPRQRQRVSPASPFHRIDVLSPAPASASPADAPPSHHAGYMLRGAAGPPRSPIRTVMSALQYVIYGLQCASWWPCYSALCAAPRDCPCAPLRDRPTSRAHLLRGSIPRCARLHDDPARHRHVRGVGPGVLRPLRPAPDGGGRWATSLDSDMIASFRHRGIAARGQTSRGASGGRRPTTR